MGWDGKGDILSLIEANGFWTYIKELFDAACITLASSHLLMIGLKVWYSCSPRCSERRASRRTPGDKPACSANLRAAVKMEFGSVQER